jgi:hypothetical protein
MRNRGRTALAEKKSISFPILSGTSMETEEETRRRPTAMLRAFFSGIASSASFATDDSPLPASASPSEAEGLNRAAMLAKNDFGFSSLSLGTGGIGTGSEADVVVVVVVEVEGVVEDELNRRPRRVGIKLEAERVGRRAAREVAGVCSLRARSGWSAFVARLGVGRKLTPSESDLVC